MASKLKRGDKVQVIAGKDKGKEGKILLVNRKKNKVIVEGLNMITKHQKANPAAGMAAGLTKKEAGIHISNVMYVHNGKPTKLGFKVETKEVDGKTVITKKRFAKSTGDIID